MDLEMVLNELSLRPLARDIYAARQRMADFVQTINVATRQGVKGMLRTPADFNAEELAPDYPIIRWANDKNVEADLRNFYLKLATNAPFLIDVHDSSIQESFSLSDFFWGEEQAVGLGVAFLLDALAVSFRSDSCWFDSHLQLKISQLDDDGELTVTFEDIPHASHYSHVREHLAWINARLRFNARTEVHEGKDIWSGKEERFPHLFFCEKVEEQLRILPQGNLVASVLRWLKKLEDYCNGWSAGPFDQYKISNNITLDSPPTLEMFSKERTFLCPDGVERIFSWHAKIAPYEWRIYFYPLPDERKLIIGYIGPHLNTVKFHH